MSLGARAEYRVLPRRRRAPDQESADAQDVELEEYLHLHLLNRGVLITPFHNMALMCPATTEADVDRHTEVFDEAVAELFGRLKGIAGTTQPFNDLMSRRKTEAPLDEQSAQCPECRSEIAVLANSSAFCTAEVGPESAPAAG